MPVVRATLSKPVGPADRLSLMQELSVAVAEGTGKSPQHIQVILSPDVPMIFGATEAPNAYVEVKSIGEYTDKGRATIIRKICEVLNARGIPGDRIYVELMVGEKPLWGTAGKPYG